MNNDPKLTDAEIDAGIEAILAKDDTEIMLDQLRELFGDDVDVDSRFTVAQVLTAMEASHHHAVEHMQIVQRAFDTAASRSINNDLIERGDAIYNDYDTANPDEMREAQQALWDLWPSISAAMQGEVGKPTEAMIDLAERAIDEWLTARDGEEIDCRALARLAVMQGEVGGLREALAGALKMIEGDGLTYPRKWDAALAASPPVDQGRIERLCKGAYLAGYSEGWLGNPMRGDWFKDVEAEKGWKLFVESGALTAALTNKGANP